MRTEISMAIKLAATLVPLSLLCAAGNTVTFDNRSGEPALVRLVGPTPREVQVPAGEKRTVNASGGKYHIKTRYGTPDSYRYTKGDEFEVKETTTARSEITITLHKVEDGNYRSHPIGASDFREPVVSSARKRDGGGAFTKEGAAVASPLPGGLRLPTGWELLSHKRVGESGHELVLKAPVAPPQGVAKAGYAAIYLGKERLATCPPYEDADDERSSALVDALCLLVATHIGAPRDKVTVQNVYFLVDKEREEGIAARVRGGRISETAVYKIRSGPKGDEPVIVALSCPNNQFDATWEALLGIVDWDASAGDKEAEQKDGQGR